MEDHVLLPVPTRQECGGATRSDVFATVRQVVIAHDGLVCDTVQSTK